MNKWAKRFIQLTQTVGSWSKDPSTKCGCVITRNNRIVSLGFNGYPSGVLDKENEPRDVKLSKTVHAEVNAILHAKGDLEGCTLYVSPMPPCSSCAAIICQTGIYKVIVGVDRTKDMSLWKESLDLGRSMFKEKDITYMEIDLHDTHSA